MHLKVRLLKNSKKLYRKKVFSMTINALKKIIPSSIKRAIINRLLTYSSKPQTADAYWKELENNINKSIFPTQSTIAQQACAEIRNSYYPILKRYNIDSEAFFWGSIKNDEAEALYQLVLDRKPDIVYQIGTFVGYSALVIAHALRENANGRLIAIDPEIPHRTFINPVNVAREAAKALELDDRIQFEHGWHSGPSGDYIGLGLKRSIPTIGVRLMEQIRDEGIDLAFIDGDHSSACTLADFLLLKDYLNVNGITVFHDVYSWPSVAQAILLLWNDIHYFVKGTSAYFALDVRRGQDGLAILERIAEEHFPTLHLKIENQQGQPVADATVDLPAIKQVAISDIDGAVYFLTEIPDGADISVSHTDYQPYQRKLEAGTNGDYVKIIVRLE
jgi:predicted O-methyltransferase YrrM